MISRYIPIITTFLFLLQYACVYAQVDCDNVVVTICYLPDEIYCERNPNQSGCGYALDGRLMANSLARKLNNPNNFGDLGVVSCPIALSPLNETITVEYIEDQDCDMIFTGNFIIDTLNSNNISGDITSLSDNLLNEIKEWSTRESTNLVITTQAEAAIWGYEIENRNQNPNTSNGNSLGESLFNGPFGFVPRFDQGGTYTGVITQGPSTGFEILGIDNNDRPTIVLDNATNDIIVGDIGVFCGSGAGAMSDGANINNNNDRLVANIFGLGCIIASSTSINVTVDLCPGEFHILPNGDTVRVEGIYLESLLTSELCDSIIITEVATYENSSSEQIHEGCVGDGYAIEVNGITYNETNRIGEETIPSSNGCDSIVTVTLIYNENSESIYMESICQEDQRLIGNEVFDVNNTTGEVVLLAANNCDSTVTVMIDIIEPEAKYEAYSICIGDTLALSIGEYTAAGRDTFYLQNQAGCDTLLIIDVTANPIVDNYDIPSSLDINVIEEYNLSIEIDPSYQIEWSPADIVSCNDCTEPTIFPQENIKSLSYTITNAAGCTITDSISLTYTCPIFLPNTFSPIGENPQNHEFGIMSSCLDLITDYSLSIFDRWGNLVFESNDTDMRWDGFNGSRVSSQGVYVYYLDYNINDEQKTDSGHITLIR